MDSTRYRIPNKEPGLNPVFDYRYYPFSGKRRPAPDGGYIGGYAFYYFHELYPVEERIFRHP